MKNLVLILLVIKLIMTNAVNKYAAQTGYDTYQSILSGQFFDIGDEAADEDIPSCKVNEYVLFGFSNGDYECTPVCNFKYSYSPEKRLELLNLKTFQYLAKGFCHIRSCFMGGYLRLSDKECILDPNDCDDGYFVSFNTMRCELPNACYKEPNTFYWTGDWLYGDPQTRTCSRTCSSENPYKDPTSQTCVASCPTGRYLTKKSSYDYSFDPPVMIPAGVCVTKCPSPDILSGNEPMGGLYLDETKNECVEASDCPMDTFGSAETNPTPKCVNSCPTSTVANSRNKKCNRGTCGEDLVRIDNNCVAWPEDCPTGKFGKVIHYDTNWEENICVKSEDCDVSELYNELTYGNPVTRKCEELWSFRPPGSFINVCPEPFYNPRQNPTYCILSASQCPDGRVLDLDDSTRTCQEDVRVDSSGAVVSIESTRYGDSTNYFRKACPSNKFAQITHRINTYKTCVNAAGCPSGMYGNNKYRVCVYPMQCSGGTYADPTTKMCQNCGIGYYGDPMTKRCIQVINGTIDCSFGYYAKPSTRMCVLPKQCSTSATTMYGNPFTKKCRALNDCIASNNCPSGLYANPTTMVFVTAFGCPSGMYGNPTTRMCVVATGCPSGMYGNPNTRTCVAETSCPHSMYANPTTRMCVVATGCPADMYGNADTRMCVVATGCPTSMNGDSVAKMCVSNCPHNTPYIQARKCISSAECPTDKYADWNTKTCVNANECSDMALTDTYMTTSKTIQSVMEQKIPGLVDGLKIYLNKTSGMTHTGNIRQCERIPFCTSPRFNTAIRWISVANKCESSCSDKKISFWYYGDRYNICVANCPGYMPLTSADGKTCYSKCPTGTFEYDNKCYSNCPTGTFEYNKTCVSNCPSGTFADGDNKKCIKNCPTGKKFDEVNTKCVDSCESGTYQLLNDASKCVRSSDCGTSKYGNPNTNQCVLNCPPADFKFYDNSNVCSNDCGPNSYNGKAHLQYTNGFATCVSECDVGKYVDNNSTCTDCTPIANFLVTSWNSRSISCTSSTNSRINSGGCNYGCNGGNYNKIAGPTADLCVCCTAGQYANPTTGNCATTCPSGYYKRTDKRICVVAADCPTNMYVNPTTTTCVVASDCPSDMYANPTTRMCVNVSSCPTNMYANPITRMCVTECSSDYYKNSVTRRCVANCSAGTYADPVTNMCVADCSPDYYKNLYTRTCVATCPLGTYADPNINMCVTECYSPDYYKREDARTCVATCPNSTYTDPATNMCVTDCSPDYYKDLYTRTCVATCPPGTYGFPTTGTCVTTCPIGYWKYEDDINLCLSCEKAKDMYNTLYTCNLDTRLEGKYLEDKYLEKCGCDNTIPVCTATDGTVASAESCTCGSAYCNATTGLFCDMSNNDRCNTNPICANTNGTVANSLDCICGNSTCTNTDNYCNNGECSATETVSMPEYILLDVYNANTPSCDDITGYEKITDTETCQTGLATLGYDSYTFDTSSGSVQWAPNECFYIPSWGLTGIGYGSDHSQTHMTKHCGQEANKNRASCICKLQN